jgi:hypothetical protein
VVPTAFKEDRVTTFIVGPPPYTDIEQAINAAGPNDTIQLQSGHRDDFALVTQTGMTVTGDTSNTGIDLHLFYGVTSFTLGGTAPFTVWDSPQARQSPAIAAIISSTFQTVSTP